MYACCTDLADVAVYLASIHILMGAMQSMLTVPKHVVLLLSSHTHVILGDQLEQFEM